MADFAQTITTAYATDGAALDLGRGVHDGAVVTAEQLSSAGCKSACPSMRRTGSTD